MYIPDGSQQDYSDSWKENRYSWGWLGDCVNPNQKGWLDGQLKSQVIDKLFNMKDHVVEHHFGTHDCELCQAENRDRSYSGNGSFLIDWDDIEYRCPEMVGHYIEAHDYNPGATVIEVIFNGKWADGEFSSN